MSKTIVITGHGRIEPLNPITLQNNLLTVCKFGEVHSGNFVKINELGIFTQPNLLYEYVFHKEDYTVQGEYKSINMQIPNIVFTPLDNTQSVKNWSWQKPYVVNHLRKMCIYDLKNIPNNNYQHVDFNNINNISLIDILNEAQNISFFPLINRTQLIDDYSNNMNNYNNGFFDINNHLCSITSSINNRVHIVDYEMGPSMNGQIPNVSDNWNILDVVNDVEQFGQNNGIDLAGAESIIVKACLSL